MAITRWGKFVKAWESRLGDPSRSGHEVPQQEVLVIRKAYRAWREDERGTGISASEWLEERAGQFERHGFRRRAAEGERIITSNWRFEIWAFDESGDWDRHGNRYAAVRLFTYDVGGAFGSGAGYSHVEPCGHAHDSEPDAMPCLRDFIARGGSPSLEDLEPQEPLLAAGGVYREGSSGERFEGSVEAWDFGVTVPWGEGRRLIFHWEQLSSVHRPDDVDGLLIGTTIPDNPNHGPTEIWLHPLAAQDREAWLKLLTDHGGQ